MDLLDVSALPATVWVVSVIDHPREPSDSDAVVSGDAGWFADPAGGPGERFFDGVRWTQATRPGPGERSAEPSRVEPAVLAAFPPPGDAPMSGVPRWRRRLVRVLPALVVVAMLAGVVAAWPDGRLPAPAPAEQGSVLEVLDGVATLQFTMDAADPAAPDSASGPRDAAWSAELASFGEGCVVEASSDGAGGAEYRLASGPEFPQVGVVVVRRASGFVEVSAVMRTEVTDPGSTWTFRSMDGVAEVGDGSVDVALDGSGFTADLVLVGEGASEAWLVGSAACS